MRSLSGCRRQHCKEQWKQSFVLLSRQSFVSLSYQSFVLLSCDHDLTPRHTRHVITMSVPIRPLPSLPLPLTLPLSWPWFHGLRALDASDGARAPQGVGHPDSHAVDSRVVFVPAAALLTYSFDALFAPSSFAAAVLLFACASFLPAMILVLPSFHLSHLSLLSLLSLLLSLFSLLLLLAEIESVGPLRRRSLPSPSGISM